VHLDAGGGAVGPLVVPGRTSCLRCADLHRRDRDPAWDALAVQLAVPPRHGAASDVAVAALVGAVAAVHALAFLDGQPTATAGGTLEMHLPDWRLRRRSWPPHPDCRCGALSGGLGKIVG
jgi:bacteriocin biosynthesis cyclodehydratase domain-containing protein